MNNFKPYFYSNFDSNCCTVCAYACAADITYNEAYEIMHNLGRVEGWGFMMTQHGVDLGLTYRPDLARRTLGKTLARMPGAGRFIIRVNGHVMAYVDGVLRDFKEPESVNNKVYMVYEYKTKTKTS